MKYRDGTDVRLGDLVSVPVPTGTASARVVMLGDSREHLPIDEQFLAWARSPIQLRTTAIVIEWTGSNPLAHHDPNLAPVGNYMFTDVDEFVEFESRAVV